MNWTLKNTTYFSAFLEIFLYLTSSDSVEHVQKVFLIVLFIYFQGKISFPTASGRYSCFEFLFWFSSLIFLKLNRFFFSACENLPNCSCHFWKHKSVFLQILHQSSVPWNMIPLCFFSSNIIYFVQKESIKAQNFWDFWVLGSQFVKLLMSVLKW